MQHDNKNFILAIVLSMAIIFGWQYFYAVPTQKKLETQTQQTQSQTQTPATTGQGVTNPQEQPGATVPGTAPPATVPREQAMAATKRIKIDTPVIDGTLNLLGARFDDIRFKNYRETVDPKSPEIALLNPSGTVGGYFAEQGFLPSGTSVKLPDSNTEWQTPADAVLAPGKPVTLTWDNGEGLVFTRTIAVDDDYLFSIKQDVTNKSSGPVSLLPYARIQRQGTPKVDGIYVLFEGLIGVLNGELDEIHYKDLKDDKKEVSKDSTGGWLGFTDKYWAAALIPDQTATLTGNFLHKIQDSGADTYQTSYFAKTAITIPAGGTGSYQDRLFAGAKVVQKINAIGEKYKIDRFDLMIDWGWFYFLTKPLFWLLEFIKSFVGNFGVAILIVTVIVKLLFFPLQNKSYESMSKMKKLQPEMEKIKAANPDDRMKQQQEIMALYKREKVSPLSGCLPILIAIPVFFALYKVIYVTIEMRHAPFFGWIKDLSAHDPTTIFNLFGLIPWDPSTVPFFGHYMMLGVWPIVMGITMWLQMRLNPTPPDPVQAQLFNWMPIIFTFMLAAFPAGLVIYWAWNNFLSILQQSFIMKRQGVQVDFFGNVRNSLPFVKRKSSTGTG
jgi:YidC/Oxa1 family membrane protein insertase